MLTSFFGKVKPLNFLIVGVFVFGIFFVWVASGFNEQFSFGQILKLFGIYALVFFSLLLLDFIIRKNALTKSNTYAVLIFGCFIGMLPVVFSAPKLLLANLFLLLAFRRIVSLQAESNPQRKVLDAALWITIASFFYFWALLFFLPLYVALLQQKSGNYKLFFIPPIGFFGIVVIKSAWQLLFFDSWQWVFSWKSPIGTDFSAYNDFGILIPVAVLGAFLVWAGIYRIGTLPSLVGKEKSKYLLLFFLVATSLVIGLLNPQRTGAELLFVFAPVAIAIGNYIENNNEFWFREALLWLLVLLPFLLLLF